MRILYLHPRAWTGEYPLLKELARLGNEVVVLEEIKRGEDRVSGLTKDFLVDGDGIPTLWYDTREGVEKLLTWPIDRVFKQAFDGRNVAHRMWVIRRASLHFKPDVVLCAEGFAYGIPAALLRRYALIDAPIFVNYIGGDVLDFPEAEVGKRRTPLTSYLIRKGVAGADILRPFSPLIGEFLIREGARKEKIHLIPGHMPANSLSLRAVEVRRDEIAQRLRLQYGLSVSAPLIVTLSGNLKGKGLHHLAEAWPYVIRAMPEARWLLCGPDSEWLQTVVWPMLNRDKVASTVVPTGALAGDAVFEHLACADLCVMPTLADGGPMSNIEAVGVGTPVLTTDRAGNATWLKDAGCGEFVVAAAPDALAEALIRLLSDLPTLKEMGIKGPALAQGFTVEAVARQITETLTELVQRSAG